MPDADFHMVCLSIQIMYEYGVSFKSARYLQEYGSFHCFTLDVLGPKHELAPKQCKGKLFGWLVGCFDDLRRFSDISAIGDLVRR